MNGPKISVKTTLLALIIIATATNVNSAEYCTSNQEINWQTNWDECKLIGDGICGYKGLDIKGETQQFDETYQNSSNDCTHCIDDDYCSIHENHQNCPDECEKPTSLSTANNGVCEQWENAMNSPQDCTCKRDYCDTRMSFLECSECADKESILTEIVNNEIKYPFTQNNFADLTRKTTITNKPVDLETFNVLLVNGQKTGGADLYIASIKAQNKNARQTNLQIELEEDQHSIKTTQLPTDYAGSFEELTLNISKNENAAGIEKIMLDHASLTDAFANEEWSTNFENAQATTRLECYTTFGTRTDASQDAKIITNPTDPSIGRELELSFDTQKAYSCLIKITFVENEEIMPTLRKQLYYQKTGNLQTTDGEAGSKTRYIDLTEISRTWEASNARITLKTNNYNAGRKFSLIINRAKLDFEDKLVDRKQKLTTTLTTGELKQTDYISGEAIMILDIKNLVYPGEQNAIQIIGEVDKSFLVTLYNLQLDYGKKPSNTEPEKYLSMPLKWGFAMQGSASVGSSGRTCGITSSYYSPNNVCTLSEDQCNSCDTQYMKEELPEDFCRITPTATPANNKTILRQYTTQDYTTPITLTINYASLYDDNSEYNFDWWLTSATITLKEYLFDARITQSTHMDENKNGKLDSSEITKIMGNDGVYMEFPGSG